MFTVYQQLDTGPELGDRELNNLEIDNALSYILTKNYLKDSVFINDLISFKNLGIKKRIK